MAEPALFAVDDDPTVLTLPDAYPDRVFDEHFLNEAIERGMARCAKHIPHRFAHACPTQNDVQEWVRSLAAASVAQARGHLVAISTGPSLLLLGPTGVGKTHLAYGAIRAVCVSGLHCTWMAITAAQAYALLRPGRKFESEVDFDRLASTQLLLLDDLGAAKSSEWTEEVNYRLINHRYEHELPTIITSNVPPRELGDAVGERVASRLTEMCQRVVLSGEDRRRRGAA